MKIEKREPERLKGQTLSTNMIVLIAIAVVAIAGIGAFFISSSLSGITNTEAQRIFAGGCTRYCSSDLYGTFQNAYQASVNDPDFVKACVQLGYIQQNEKSFMNRCFERCGNCNLDVQTTDTNGGVDNLIAKTTRG